MYEAQASRLVRRLARRAGLKSAGQLSPHSLRHTFATSLDAAGVPLQDGVPVRIVSPAAISPIAA
jgi:integrase